MIPQPTCTTASNPSQEGLRRGKSPAQGEEGIQSKPVPEAFVKAVPAVPFAAGLRKGRAAVEYWHEAG